MSGYCMGRVNELDRLWNCWKFTVLKKWGEEIVIWCVATYGNESKMINEWKFGNNRRHGKEVDN